MIDLSWIFPRAFTELETVWTILKRKNPCGNRPHRDHYLDLLTEMHTKMDAIVTHVIPRITEAFHYDFRSPDLVKAIFFHPSLESFFRDLENYVTRGLNKPRVVDFGALIQITRVGKHLALLGDTILDLAISHFSLELRPPHLRKFDYVRQKWVGNQNLARVCDRLGLCEYRIVNTFNLPPINPEKIPKVKGDLVEAIYGVIYVESGLDPVMHSFWDLLTPPKDEEGESKSGVVK